MTTPEALNVPVGLVAGGVGKRAIWSGVDQAANTASNFLLTAMVARQSSAEVFGTFAIAYGVFSFAAAISQALVSETMLVTAAGSEDSERRRIVADTTGLALMVGLFSSIILLYVAYTGSTHPASVFVLALASPFVFMQDNLRLSMIGAGRPRSAATNDGIWLALQIATALALSLSGIETTSAIAVLIWGGSGTVCAGVALAQLSIRPRPKRGLVFVLKHRRLGSSYVIESLSLAGAAQLTILVVGATSGLASSGALRTGQAIYGPVNVVFIVLRMFGVAEAGRLRLTHKVRRFSTILAIAGASAGASVTLALLAIPGSLGVYVFGESWAGGSHLLLAFGLQKVAVGISTGSFVVFRISRDTRRTTVSRVSVALLSLAGGVSGAIIDGATGAAWGLTVASFVGAIVLRWSASRALAKMGDVV